MTPGYRELHFRITGAESLIMHNGSLADPLHPSAIALAAITSKRKKTTSDHLEAAHREWMGGLYLTDGVPCLPLEMLEAAMIKGAQAERRGPQAKAGIVVPEDAKLIYDGPSDPAELMKDERFRKRVRVRVGTASIMRTRPMFSDWSAMVRIRFSEETLNERDVESFLARAGNSIGIGDWRPRYGRFTIEKIAVEKGAAALEAPAAKKPRKG